jgi:hypothetical protein
MSKKKGYVCEHCGSKVVEYTFSFNKGLAGILFKLYKADRPVAIEELRLSYAQYTNAPKLNYWDLAVPWLTEETKRKRGWWKITNRGRLFVEGGIQIQRKVVMKKKHFVRYEGEAVAFKQIHDRYLYHGDYADQVSGQL